MAWRLGEEAVLEVHTERTTLAVTGAAVDAVTAVVHWPARADGPPLLVTHGAGGDLDGAGLTALADAVARSEHVVVRANLPYREAGTRKAPPRAERCIDAYAQVLAAARERFGPDAAWLAGGKSYGGRVASLAAAAGMAAAGLVFYGYPLHPPGQPERPRTDHWPDLDVPCLFLQGDRDPFCDLRLLDRELPRLAAPATVHVVDGGDHSLRVPAKAASGGVARSETAVTASLGEVVARWAAGLG